MSFDLAAFDPSATNDKHFARWYQKQAKWSEKHNYDDPSVCTPQLRAFYNEIIESYPPMNGPDSPGEQALDNDPALERRLSDYSLGSQIVYGAFAWSEAEKVQPLFLELAKKHKVAVALFESEGIVVRRP